MKKRLIILGAGGHGRSVADMVLAREEFDLIGFLDDASPELQSVWNIPVLGAIGSAPEWRSAAEYAFVAIGNNAARESFCIMLRAAGFSLPTLIHPQAIVSSRAVIGEATAIMAGSIVGTEAELGEGVIVNAGAVVDHHAQVEDYAHLGVGAMMAGGTCLGRSAWMQAGAALGYGVRIPEGTVLPPAAGVGAGVVA